MDVKTVLNRDPWEKVIVVQQRRRKARVAEIFAKVRDTYVLKRVGQARYIGDGDEERFEWDGLEIEAAYRSWVDLSISIRISLESVSVVGVADAAAEPVPVEA